MALIILILLSLFMAVDATPATSYPVNAQLPPVARVSQPFKFTFAQGTFTGSDSEITYSLSNAPSWLKVDSTTRTFSGTPSKGDVGSPLFNLVASDQSGNATMQVTLVVTTVDGPKPGKPLYSQLEAIGPTSSPSSVIIHSGDSFSFSFDSDTFSNTLPSTVYYGTSAPDNAPLPSWVRFDSSSLRFYGTAPGSGPETFSFNLVASDVSGFSAATMGFQIVVSPHLLYFNQSADTLFVTRGQSFSSPSFAKTLTLDGQNPQSSQLSGIDVDIPDWLTLDRNSLSFSGTPPVDGDNENVTFSVTDIYQDVAKLVITLQYSQFFSDKIDGCYAIIGQYFSYEFNSSILTNTSAQLDVDLGQQLPWLQYNRENKTIYGQVPSNLTAENVTINLTAREGTAEDKRTFTIKLETEDSALEDGTADASDPNSSEYKEKKAGIIAMSIFLPVGVVSIILFFLFCRRRRQKRVSHEEEKAPDDKPLPPQPPHSPPPDVPTLSHSQPFESTRQGAAPTMGGPITQSSKPPKLELEPWWNAENLDDESEQREEAPDTVGKVNHFSSSTIEWDFTPLQGREQDENKPPTGSPIKANRFSLQSSSPVRRRTSTNSGRREPLKAIQPRRSLKRSSVLSSRSKRYSKRSSGISSIASGLPVRLSGAGHGAGGFGPPGHGVVRVSWQNTHASLQSDESSVGNLAPLFPRPPRRKRDSQECSKRMSLRTVDRDSMISESDSLEAFVQGRAKSRNSSNPMFSGQISSRRVSSGLRALERARSNASRADTVNSSNCVEEGQRRSILERPLSLVSGSIYTDDNRYSTYLRSLSEESSTIQPLAPIVKGQSQSSLAQNYSNIITSLPRFCSELSLNTNIKRDGTPHGEAYSPNDGQPIIRYWARSSPFLQREMSATGHQAFRKSPSTSSIPYDSKTPRVMLKRSEADPPYPQGFQRDFTGSARSDIAFV